jgi:glucose-1-phosphate thymidylyltransferase
MSRRAVVLARGRGSRMRREDAAARLDAEQAAAAAAGAKAMMPVGRPLLEHLLSALAEAGIEEAVLVIGPGQDPIRAHFAANPPRRLRLVFAVQQEARGTADAVRSARAAAGADCFVVVNGDTWYPPQAIRAVAAAPAPALGAFDGEALVRLGNVPAERLLAFALCDVAADGSLREIVEKPGPEHALARAARHIVSMNLWHLPPAVFAALERVQPSPRGELELLDAVRLLMRDGARVLAVPLACELLDLSSRADVAAVTARLAGRAVDF